MASLELPGDIRVALSHLAAYGLAVILEDAGASGVMLSWTPSLESRAVVTADVDELEIGRIVHEHAVAGARPDSWVRAESEAPGAREPVGCLSPRIKPPDSDERWLRLAADRRGVIDRVVDARGWLDLAMIGALGEPAYWRRDTRGERRPDEGASRWEMKTRNRGEDFVKHRLRALAQANAARGPADVFAGLAGTREAVDEVGGNRPDSRTATGLAAPGPVDNARAWCALWGLSLLPTIHQVGGPSLSAGHRSSRGRGARRGWFHLPVIARPVTVSRLALILASEELVLAAAAWPDEVEPTLRVISARRWLVDRGAAGIVHFPIGEFGSDNAPERRALLGTVVRLTD